MNKFKYIQLCKIKGSPVYLHWSLSLILIVCFAFGFGDFSIVVGALSFFGILALHELGHMWFASRHGLKTFRINLYPFHGVCVCEESNFVYENYMVAWGGVVAQAIVFVPCIIVSKLIGNNLPWYVNTPLLFFGYFSAMIAIFNLAPARGLDGYYCWRAIPIMLNKMQEKNKKSKKNHLKRIK